MSTTASLESGWAARPDQKVRAPVAAGLSFLFPGLGQAYNRQYWLAALFALPAGFVILLGIAASDNPTAVAIHMLDVRFLLGILALDSALLAWRVIAIVQAHLAHGWRGIRHWTSWVTIVLILATLGMHALPAWYAGAAVGTLSAISRGGSGGGGILNWHDVLPANPGASTAPTPQATPMPLDSRLTVLLVGIDFIPTRNSTFLTDTMIVATMDPRTGIDLISVPRDTFGTPLGDGRVYDAKLNSLLAIANKYPDAYPLGPTETLKTAVGELVGLHIDYMAAVQVLGFKSAIDALGGVDVTVDRQVADPTYIDEFDHHTGFYITPGDYHMDGHTALGYARSRKGVGDSDFTRAARQQQLLVALLRQLTAANVLVNLPTLLGIVGDSVATDVPLDSFSQIAAALQAANPDEVQRLVLQYPYTHSDTLTDGTYILVPDLDAIQAAVDELTTFEPGQTPPPD